ncbi:MAG: YraN family protein [Hyphomonadaceae bacterium]|nr:YraN family protein [Hyphomonadaceae bacterium]
MARAERIAAERRGRRGEWLAALALQLKGYRILARRVRTPSGEIDLVARRGAIFAFIEVKARASVEDALDAVSERAWQRISAAAEIWAARHMPAGDFGWRYDLVAILPRQWPKHLRDAWRPDFALTGR